MRRRYAERDNSGKSSLRSKGEAIKNSWVPFNLTKRATAVPPQRLGRKIKREWGRLGSWTSTVLTHGLKGRFENILRAVGSDQTAEVDGGGYLTWTEGRNFRAGGGRVGNRREKVIGHCSA